MESHLTVALSGTKEPLKRGDELVLINGRDARHQRTGLQGCSPQNNDQSAGVGQGGGGVKFGHVFCTAPRMWHKVARVEEFM